MGLSAQEFAAKHNREVAEKGAGGQAPDAPAAGHNSAGANFAKEQLKAVIERVERLEEEKKAIADDIKDVYTEAKAHGFDVKAIRTLVRERKQDSDERAEQEAILDAYRMALGMLS